MIGNVNKHTIKHREVNEKPIVRITNGIIIAIGITNRKSSQGSNALSSHINRLIRIPETTPTRAEIKNPMINDWLLTPNNRHVSGSTASSKAAFNVPKVVGINTES
jgi:hypothetical protein